MAEVYRVVHYPKFQKYINKQLTSSSALFAKIESLCTVVHVERIVSGVCSDADDEKFLSCALAANVEVLVSGDRHLLNLKQYQSVRIVTAREFYEENIHKIT
jgi:putative PIN family toxin of toxin-antitoxin system